MLEEEEDINQIMAYFSYEHFYVIYCKFWELDRDHDLFIDQNDLARHNDHGKKKIFPSRNCCSDCLIISISTQLCRLVLSSESFRAVLPKVHEIVTIQLVYKRCHTQNLFGFYYQKRTRLTPQRWNTGLGMFILADSWPTFWIKIFFLSLTYRCMDLDGDGVLSMYELEYFYEEQQHRMESIGIETLPFEDCLCQMLDMIKPMRAGYVTLSDLKRCKMTPIFYDTFFNLEKYMEHEQRDPFATQRDQDEVILKKMFFVLLFIISLIDFLLTRWLIGIGMQLKNMSY